MTNNPNELTIENSALVLIDHQPAVGLAVHSIDQGLLVTNVASLARAAKALGVPTVLTTIGAKGSVLVDPIFKEISDVFPEITPIDRTTTHAWSDPNFRAAVDATGRRKLVMAGIVTGTCLSQSVLAALKDGFEVYFVSDCSGDVSREAHDDAKVLMTQAGAKPITWLNLTGQWAPDYRSPQRAALASIYSQRIGTVALMTEYVIDQVTAGVVPLPDFLSAPVPAGAGSAKRSQRFGVGRPASMAGRPRAGQSRRGAALPAFVGERTRVVAVSTHNPLGTTFAAASTPPSSAPRA